MCTDNLTCYAGKVESMAGARETARNGNIVEPGECWVTTDRDGLGDGDPSTMYAAVPVCADVCAGSTEGKEASYHPPGSAAAASWASLTLGSSRPLRDIAPVVRQRPGASVVCDEGSDRIQAATHARVNIKVEVGSFSRRVGISLEGNAVAKQPGPFRGRAGQRGEEICARRTQRGATSTTPRQKRKKTTKENGRISQKEGTK